MLNELTTELLRGGGAAGFNTRNAKHLGLRVTIAHVLFEAIQTS